MKSKSSRTKVRNLGLKLTAIILAMLLELYFYSPENATTVVLPARILVENVPPSMILVQPRRKVVQVKLRGPRLILDSVKGEDLKFRIDLSGAPRSFGVHLKGSELGLPPAVDVLDILPKSVNFVLDDLAKRQLPVVVETRGTPPEGYVLIDVIVTPEIVTASGPRSEVADETALTVRPVDLSGFSRSRKLTLPIRPPGPLTTLSAGVVSAYFDIRSVEKLRTFRGVNVKVLAPNGFAATVSPSKVDVVLTGSSEGLGKLDSKSLDIFADGTRLGAGSYGVRLAGNLPRGVDIVKTVPPSVNLKLVNTKK